MMTIFYVDTYRKTMEDVKKQGNEIYPNIYLGKIRKYTYK